MVAWEQAAVARVVWRAIMRPTLMALLSPQMSPAVHWGALELSAGSYKTINILSPWNCGYVCEPCSASHITNSLRFLHSFGSWGFQGEDTQRPSTAWLEWDIQGGAGARAWPRHEQPHQSFSGRRTTELQPFCKPSWSRPQPKQSCLCLQIPQEVQGVQTCTFPGITVL